MMLVFMGLESDVSSSVTKAEMKNSRTRVAGAEYRGNEPEQMERNEWGHYGIR